MSKHLFRNLGIAMLAGGSVIGVAGCSSKSTSKSSSSDLAIYTESATYEGKLTGYVGKLYKDRLGLNVSVTPNVVGGTNRLETRLTTGNLGDLVLFTSQEDLKKAIKAGAVEDLSDDMSKLKNVSKYKDMLARVKKEGKGKIYGFTQKVSMKSETTKTDPTFTPSLRYDYYKELGSPKINNFWDYKTVIDQMVKAHPKTEGGNKFYGLSLFSEWDGYSVNLAKSIGNTMGWTTTDGVNTYNFMNIGTTADKTDPILSENSNYLKALKWFNSFYREGELDPDSASQTWADYMKKAEKGQSAIWIFGYMGNLNFNPVNSKLTAQKKGYERIPFASMKVADQKTSTVGTNWYWAVSSKAKNKAGALKFLNYAYSPEGAMENQNGPKGVLWKTNSSNQLTRTALGGKYDDAKIPEKDGGGKKGDTYLSRVNGPSVDADATNTKYNSPANMNVWETTLKSQASALDKEWTADHAGALNAKEYLLKNNLLGSYTVEDVPVHTYDDKLAVVAKQVGDMIKEYSWKMIYAKDDATYNKLEQEMISKAKSLGYDKCVAFEQKTADNYFAARK